MYSIVTEGIKVSVEPDFLEILRNRGTQEYAFSYKVIIQNQSNEEIKLLSRYWNIFDASGMKRIVEGEGVVGHQPVLKMGESFTYESWCPLISPIGFMEGFYTCINRETNEKLKVQIPRFQLVTPFLLN